MPRSRDIQVLKQAYFRFTWTNSGMAKANVRTSPSRKSFLSEHLINYNPPKENSSDRLLIITDPAYEAGLSLFSQYKQNTGMSVQIISTGTIGNNPSTIQNHIQSKDPDYVLLVGSVSEIPCTGGNPSSEDIDNPMTDQGYRRWSGDEKIYGDVFQGRWPVESTQDLANIINKTIKTETSIAAVPKRAVFLAGHEDNLFMRNSFKRGHENAIEEGFSPAGYQCEKYYQSSTNVIEALKETYPFWFLYAGHGNKGVLAYDRNFGIMRHYWDREDVYPFVFSFACKTGNYSDRQCIACTPTSSSTGPSVYFGSSVNTFCNSDVAMEKKILGSSFGAERLGVMIAQGMTEYRKRFWSRLNTTRSNRYMKAYNLMGDPSLLKEGLPSVVTDYVFSQRLEAVAGIDLAYECSRNMTIAQGVSLLGNAALQFKAGKDLVVSGIVSGSVSSKMDLDAERVFFSNARIGAGSVMDVRAEEIIVLQPGTEISAGSEVVLKIE